MPNIAPVTDLDYTVEEMSRHVARFKGLKSTAKAFIDTRIPGHERDIFNIIGANVIEDPDVKPALPAQDFHLAIVRCEPGKGAALHSHLTQEGTVAGSPMPPPRRPRSMPRRSRRPRPDGSAATSAARRSSASAHSSIDPVPCMAARLVALPSGHWDRLPTVATIEFERTYQCRMT